jgi:hypothetical protein
MNGACREEIRRILTLIEEAKGILEMVLDQEQACCDDAISGVVTGLAPTLQRNA